MKILITGAGGFVGNYLIRELLNDKDNVIFGSVYKATSDISNLLPSDNIVEGDLTDFSFTDYLIKTIKPDLIFHLAALSVVGNSFENAVKIMNSNTTLSFNVLESTRLHAPNARFIAICSANEYGSVEGGVNKINESTPLRPINPYAVSKVTQEMLALQYHLAYGMDIVILRPFNHTGVGQTTDFVIPRLAKQFAEIENASITPIIEVGNLDSVRDFTDVRDMVHAYALAAKHAKQGEIYNIGSGVGVSIAQMIEILQSLVSTKVEIKVKNDLVRFADVPKLISDNTKFHAITSYEASIPLTQTISDILNSYRNQKG